MAADITISTPTVLDAGIDTTVAISYLGSNAPQAAVDASVDTTATAYDLNFVSGTTSIVNSMPGSTGGGGGGGGGGGSVRPTTGMLYPRGQG